MLKLLEGSDVEVPVGANSKNAMVPLTTVNTKNILFICGGAFPDLEGIIKERLTKQATIGFGADLKDKYNNDKNILSKVTTEDLRNFGMIPEFLGRLPIVFTLQGLNEEMMVKILKEPKNAILKQYQKLAPGHFGQSSKNLCWILCMRFQRMTILVRSLLQRNT